MERSICILDESGLRLRLLVKGFRLPLVNAVRRACFTDVPVMAVDTVEVFDNNTVLYDEIIAHRLGLIPLTSEEALEKYGRPEKCRGAELGDPSCYATLSLDVSTGEAEERMVYSGDLESDDPSVKPVFPNMPIVLMAPRQRLRLRAYARLGYGKEHAKWMPVSVAAHRYVPVVEFVYDEMSEECRRCVEMAYPGILEEMERRRRGRLRLLGDRNTSGLYWCVKKRCSGGISLRYDDTEYIFTVESTGALPPGRILVEAARAVAGKAEKLLARVRELRREHG